MAVMPESMGETTSRVLVAEDDAETRAMLVAALGEALPAVEFRQAGNGRDALAIARSGGIDLILCEVSLRGLDGLQLTRRVREDPATAGIYMILYTGLSSREKLFPAMDQGADDCLLKPFRWEELVVRVRAGLRRLGSVRELSRRAGEWERLYARQSEFLSHVSHEIRTPLSAIQSSANILMRYGKSRPDSVERFSLIIHQEGQRLTRLINDLLDLAKIEAGEVEWHFKATPVEDVIGRVRDSFSALLAERNLRLEVGPYENDRQLWGDRDKLIQVLSNLVSNAIKHSPVGGAVHLRCANGAENAVRIEVEDEGDGIPDGWEEKIFERFQQASRADGDEERERVGTGLGLTIARTIVEYHGGRIWAAPGRTKGAMFVIELPQHKPEQVPDGAVR